MDTEKNEDSVNRSEQAKAASAHSRINMPLNMENWRHLDEATSDLLLWFHQHCLDRKMGLKEASEALGYDESTIFRVLKGTYTGSWANVKDKIKSYKRIDSERGLIQKNEFVRNSISGLIYGALDYAVANSSITLITGESRMGKSISASSWRDSHNHGRSVLITAPAVGGTKGLLRRIAGAVGVNKNLAVPQMAEAIFRAFNRNRILIVDEAHRLLPNERRSNPTNLEIIRDLHDETHCAVALIATQRFSDTLKGLEYQYEQLLGRIGLPVRLPRVIPETDVAPILKQYVKRPSAKLMREALAIANSTGRLGILVEVLKITSRVAAKARRDIEEADFFKGAAMRKQMMGELAFASKDKEGE